MFSSQHRTKTITAALLVALATFWTGAGSAIAGPSQEATCPSGSNPSLWDPRLSSTVSPATGVYNRSIELRYHSSTRCAWGRITNGNPGDSVWVDWSNNGGASWHQLSVTRINRGYTQAFTPAYNDRGYLVRACGKAGDRPDVRCTPWY